MALLWKLQIRSQPHFRPVQKRNSVCSKCTSLVQNASCGVCHTQSLQRVQQETEVKHMAGTWFQRDARRFRERYLY